MGGNDTLNAKEGNDYLDGGVGNDTLTGGNGDDYLLGGDGNDSISGDAGNDSIDGGNGDNKINGGEGIDIIITDSGNDSVDAGNGDDSVESGSGNDTVYSGGGNDTVNSGAGDDMIYGQSGNDIINSGEGNDHINNVREKSVIHAGNGNDLIDQVYDGSIFGDAGNDNISGYAGSYYGGDGNDVLTLFDSIIGGYVFLQGDAGNDILSSGLGYNHSAYAQTFIGGLDADKITTGGGKDTIRYDALTDSGVGTGNRDIITNFDTSSGAVIDLYRLSDSLTFLGMKPFDGTKGAVHLNVDAPNKQTIVQIDMNGDKMPEMEIELTGIKILAADDFILSVPKI